MNNVFTIYFILYVRTISHRGQTMCDFKPWEKENPISEQRANLKVIHKGLIALDRALGTNAGHLR